MKRLLSVVAVLAVAASLLPEKGQAGLRGAFDPITIGDNLFRGKFSPVLRGGITGGSGTASSPRLERWVAFVTLSQVFGKESTGEIYLQRNTDQAQARGFDPVPLRKDDTGLVSYIDPEWSKDGKWLAYVQTDNEVSAASIYIQQFDTSTATDGGVPLGSPILVANGAGGVHHRHPSFNSTATQVAYDSDAFGPSIDLWTVNVSLDPVAHTGTVNEASRTRHQLGLEGDPTTLAILNSKAEFKPAYSPNDSKIAYVTNRFGSFQIQILTPTASGTLESSQGAESNPALITHDNPSWSSDGLSLYYDAPANEDAANPQDIWKLELASGSKCAIFVDLAGDVDPDVSQYINPTREGILFNYFVFISQGGGFGLQVWRAEYVQTCVAPLPMAVTISPSSISADSSGGGDIIATCTFPQGTIDAGYVMRAANQPNGSGFPENTKEGVRFRRTIIASPTMLGLTTASTPYAFSTAKTIKGDCTNMDMRALLGLGPTETIPCYDPEPDPNLCFGVNCIFGNIGHYEVAVDTLFQDHHVTRVFWGRRRISDRLQNLGLTDRFVALPVRAYSNRVGRTFLGFGFIRVTGKSGGGHAAVALRQNYPNPFNPVTKIRFAVNKPGSVDVRVFNTRGELVRTITNTWYPQGEHEVSWDGKTKSGGHAPSGIYYIRAKSGDTTDVIKAVLAK